MQSMIVNTKMVPKCKMFVGANIYYLSLKFTAFSPEIS